MGQIESIENNNLESSNLPQIQGANGQKPQEGGADTTNQNTNQTSTDRANIFGEKEKAEEKIYLKLNVTIHKQLTILGNWHLSQLRQIFEKHQLADMPLHINKEEFRALLNLEKQTSDYVFCKLAKLHKNLNSQREISQFQKCKSLASFQAFGANTQARMFSPDKSNKLFNPHNASTLSILGTLIKENKIKKWNHDTVNIYEVLCGMAVLAYANYFQKIRFIYNLFDFDGNQALDINEVSILVICFCAGWTRFTDIKMPSNKKLEGFGEYIYNAAETVPDGKISIQDLGHWIEVNDEIMGMLSRYEPPLEVEEKDSNFLKLDRSKYDLVQNSQKYLSKRAFQIKNEFDQNNKFKNMKSNIRRAPLLSSNTTMYSQKYDMDNNLTREQLKLPNIGNKVKKNILTVKGKTYKKSDVLCFKKYFDSIDEDHTGQLTLDQYVRSISKSDHLRRIAVSLFNFLDKDQNGYLSFEEMLYKIIPGATKDHVNKMMAWVKEEDEVTIKAVLNYKMPSLQQKKTDQKVLSFQQMRDYIHVFVNIDHDLDGFVNIENFRKCFSTVMNSKQIHDLFLDPVTNDFRKIEINEFLEIMKPKECVISREILKTQVKEYLYQLMIDKRSDLIERGLLVPSAMKKSMIKSSDDKQPKISIADQQQYQETTTTTKDFKKGQDERLKTL